MYQELLKKVSYEINKYALKLTSFSLFPFCFNFDIYYLPENKKVGFLKAFLFKFQGEVEIKIDSGIIKVEFKDNSWNIYFKN